MSSLLTNDKHFELLIRYCGRKFPWLSIMSIEIRREEKWFEFGKRWGEGLRKIGKREKLPNGFFMMMGNLWANSFHQSRLLNSNFLLDQSCQASNSKGFDLHFPPSIAFNEKLKNLPSKARPGMTNRSFKFNFSLWESTQMKFSALHKKFLLLMSLGNRIFA